MECQFIFIFRNDYSCSTFVFLVSDRVMKPLKNAFRIIFPHFSWNERVLWIYFKTIVSYSIQKLTRGSYERNGIYVTESLSILETFPYYLRKRKLIEGRLPHVFIAKDIAQVTDQKIEYSKHKGLDDKKCEALLLNSLKDHGFLTKPEIVRLLWDVLPDQLDDKQKEYKINNLLRKLRTEGKISNTTVAGNKSTWALVKD